MKRVISAVLILFTAISFCACGVTDEQVVIREDMVQYSRNTAMAEALAAYANFIRKNPYPCGEKDAKTELLIDSRLIKQYSEHYRAMSAAGADGQNSPFIEYGQTVLELEKYIECDEFILFANGLEDIMKSIAYLVKDGRRSSGEHDYEKAKETMDMVRDKYSEVLKMAESTASTENDMREMTAVMRGLKGAIDNELDAIEERSIIEILRYEEEYDDLLGEYEALLERADGYAGEIARIEEDIASLSSELKMQSK